MRKFRHTDTQHIASGELLHWSAKMLRKWLVGLCLPTRVLLLFLRAGVQPILDPYTEAFL